MNSSGFSDHPASRYRREEGRYCIDIRLHSWRQFFDSRDPAPFLERDLDDDAVAYIVNCFREIGEPANAKLVLHIAEGQDLAPGPEVFTDAVHGFFAGETRFAEGRRRLTYKQGRQSIVIGVLFLALCMLLLRWSQTLIESEVVKSVVREGLTILGWVAMWRPIDLMLYAWWPHVFARRTYAKLSKIEVEVVFDSGVA